MELWLGQAEALTVFFFFFLFCPRQEKDTTTRQVNTARSLPSVRLRQQPTAVVRVEQIVADEANHQRYQRGHSPLRRSPSTRTTTRHLRSPSPAEPERNPTGLSTRAPESDAKGMGEHGEDENLHNEEAKQRGKLDRAHGSSQHPPATRTNT